MTVVDIDGDLQEAVSRFHNDGYILVPGALSADEALSCRREVLGMIPEDLSVPFRWDFRNGRVKPLHADGGQSFKQPGLLRSWQNAQLYRLAAAIIGTHRLRVFDGSLAITFRNDRAPAGLAQRLHIDHAVPRRVERFRVDELELEVGGFFYLTDVVEGGGGIRIVRGGHHWVRSVMENDRANRQRYDSWTDITEEFETTEIPGKAGDFVMLHYLTPHAATHNRAETTRVAQFVRWVREDYPYGVPDDMALGTYDTPAPRFGAEQLSVMTGLGRRLHGVDPW